MVDPKVSLARWGSAVHALDVPCRDWVEISVPVLLVMETHRNHGRSLALGARQKAVPMFFLQMDQMYSMSQRPSSSSWQDVEESRSGLRCWFGVKITKSHIQYDAFQHPMPRIAVLQFLDSESMRINHELVLKTSSMYHMYHAKDVEQLAISSESKFDIFQARASKRQSAIRQARWGPLQPIDANRSLDVGLRLTWEKVIGVIGGFDMFWLNILHP